MSIETRHTEKAILFQLLDAAETGEWMRVLSHIMATMEPEDVELVQKQYADFKAKKQG